MFTEYTEPQQDPIARPADLAMLKKAGCNWNPTPPDNVRIHELACWEGVCYAYEDGWGSFHPDGHCGCVLGHDEYVFGSRCDHLIWMDGEDEHNGPSVLIVGNHKGCLIMSLLYDPDQVDPYAEEIDEAIRNQYENDQN